jgi:hypothetical protein
MGNSLSWTADEAVIELHSDGLYSVSVQGFPSQGESGVLLPEKTVMLPVPLTGEVSVRVVPMGVKSLGPVPPIAMSSFVDGVEVFVEAPLSSIPSDWGGLVDRGTFRRAGYVSVRLNPVIQRGGDLLQAGSLQIELVSESSSRSETVRGHEGEILSAVLGTNQVWRESVSRGGDSPFWGKPWARIEVDTAGVFAVTGEMIPEAVGMPSGSFSMMTGRGRMMSFDDPESDSFQPRPVSIRVEDGGDGIFDSSDRVLFYGRGLSWWGEFMGEHFNSRYSHQNTYWLTWGGEGGPFMDVLDGSVTGAPLAGSSYVNRLHFEQNAVLTPSYSAFSDFYGWHRITSGTANYGFLTPGAQGDGTMRFHIYLDKGSNVQLTATVNGSFMADTLVMNHGDLLWEYPVSGLKTSGNSITISISSGSSFTLYTDWYEVFPETGFRSWSSQCQVPLDREFPSGERRLVTWAQSLGSDAFAFVALSDTAVAMIDLPGGKDFEVDMPAGWSRPVMWVVPGGDFLEPVSVSAASPGRIVETLSSGSTVYIYPDEFAADMPLFQRGRPDVLMLSLTEVYDEFNGGVRDPGALRAFFGHTLKSWNEPPDQLVLVGAGHWDPRQFLTENPCPMDIVTYLFSLNHLICSDFYYTTVSSSGLPQAAVSRIPVDSRTELQLVAQRSFDYGDPTEECGTWQSVILGAADDERHPDHPTYDETYHTIDAEEVFTEHVPNRFIPLRNYLIFWDWNSNWKKPQARAAFIENWSRGALVTFFLGHGGFDQIADEGLLFIDDVDALACGPRLPYAFFGSCEVGLFQNPGNACIAENVTLAPSGGAIVASGATDQCNGPANADFFMEILDILLESSEFTIAECQWMGMLNHGVYGNDKIYTVFGDGSLCLALPGTDITVTEPELYTSQLCGIEGSLHDDGLVMLTAWESASPDSYFTRSSQFLIEYLSTPGVFYRGLAQASPGFTAEMFVPEVATTGDLARVRYFAPGEGGGDLVCSYPLSLEYGQGSPGDTVGPDIEMWISGFRGVENPSVSGEAVFEASLSDQSGINLLPWPGNQLALYIDQSPLDVSDYFVYQPGSATTGGIVFPLPELQPGAHLLRLRAADNLSNISWQEMTFTLTEGGSPEISQFFVYPTPASTVMSFNWTQSSDGPVDISLFTVSGRCIRVMGNLPCGSGYNQHNWDLTDEDGDKVASGTYIYVVSSGDSSVSGATAILR